LILFFDWKNKTCLGVWTQQARRAVCRRNAWLSCDLKSIKITLNDALVRVKMYEQQMASKTGDGSYTIPPEKYFVGLFRQ